MPFAKLSDGTLVHLCTRGRRKPGPCECCGLPSSVLCDGKVPGRKRPCSRRLCLTCADHRGPEYDLCPSCAKAYPQQLELK